MREGNKMLWPPDDCLSNEFTKENNNSLFRERGGGKSIAVDRMDGQINMTRIMDDTI